MITREFDNEELIELIEKERGFRLRLDPMLGGEMMIESDHGFAEWFAGPFLIDQDNEIQIYITYTATDSLSVRFLIRDCEGDFLNQGVVETINDKPIYVGFEHPYFDQYRDRKE